MIIQHFNNIMKYLWYYFHVFHIQLVFYNIIRKLFKNNKNAFNFYNGSNRKYFLVNTVKNIIKIQDQILNVIINLEIYLIMLVFILMSSFGLLLKK